MFGDISFWKTFFIVMVFSITFFLLTKWADSGEPLIQDSLAEDPQVVTKVEPLAGSLSELFHDLGVQPAANGISNPCFDLENYSEKYCTVHGVNLVLASHYLVKMDELLLNEMLRHQDPCHQISTYIGRICEQQNFLKIFKHFAIKH